MKTYKLFEDTTTRTIGIGYTLNFGDDTRTKVVYDTHIMPSQSNTILYDGVAPTYPKTLRTSFVRITGTAIIDTVSFVFRKFVTKED